MYVYVCIYIYIYIYTGPDRRLKLRPETSRYKNESPRQEHRDATSGASFGASVRPAGNSRQIALHASHHEGPDGCGQTKALSKKQQFRRCLRTEGKLAVNLGKLDKSFLTSAPTVIIRLALACSPTRVVLNPAGHIPHSLLFVSRQCPRILASTQK